MIVICAKFNEKVKHFIYNLVWARTVSVYLVYNNNRRFVQAKSLFKHKSCLRHAALKCINKQQNTVNHGKNSLNFSSEIGVAGGVNNVDFCVVVMNCRVFRKNCYASFSFKVIAVHNTLVNNLVCAESAALAQHFVNKCCFAVVNMGNYCYVFYVFSYAHFFSLIACPKQLSCGSCKKVLFLSAAAVYFFALKLSLSCTVRLKIRFSGPENLSAQK